MHSDVTFPLLLHSTLLVLLESSKRRLAGNLGRNENSQSRLTRRNYSGSLSAQEKILTGYKGNPKTNWRKFQEALTPKHVAISLTGEPTLYEPLGDLIEAFHQKGFTTFLVSNGTLPTKTFKTKPRTYPTLHFSMRTKRGGIQAGLPSSISQRLDEIKRDAWFIAEFPLPYSDSHDTCKRAQHALCG